MSRRQMSLTDDIKQCRTPAEALLLLAKHVENLTLAVDNLVAEREVDPWAQPLEWDDPTTHRELHSSELAERVAADRTAAVEAVKAELATAVGEDADALRAKLRLLTDTGRSIEPAVPVGARAAIHSDGTAGEVELPPVSEERKQARRTWAEQSKLHEFVPHLTAEQAVDAFEKGGPMWLYLGNRGAIMQMPRAWRHWLIGDIAQDSQAEAQQVARDILKFDESTDQAVTVQAIDALSASRGLR